MNMPINIWKFQFENKKFETGETVEWTAAAASYLDASSKALRNLHFSKLKILEYLKISS